MKRQSLAWPAMLAVLAFGWLLQESPDGGWPFAHAKGVDQVTEGILVSLDDQGRPAGVCPLKHTDVEAEISGHLVRVNVTQEFENPYEEKIEAVYTFPLPQNAAVDDMTMEVGDRKIRGEIKRREEAREIYDQARKAGHVAALLDQERPNIFTQSVANILPGEKVTIHISYVETLEYEEGAYEFVFPMVVGPRYIPGNLQGKQGPGWSPDTDQVPDASRITPPVTPEGTRAGHDISVKVSVDAGVPILRLASKTHDVDIRRTAPSRAAVDLKRKAVLPNKDFILSYDVAGKKIEDAVLSHQAAKSGFFAMILQPPERVTVEDVTPKELVFVLDVSGSMSGFPIEKAKETMKLALDGLYPRDTFNLITFAGRTQVLFPSPVPASEQNLRAAQEFLASRRGGGGTEMMKAIRTALEPSDSQEHVRIVCFMTDGYVGNDMAILEEIRKHPNARVFSFGIGNSANRFLLDKMAELGRGEVEYVTLKDDGSAAARRFHERVRNPLLTDIEIDWASLPVEDVYPKRIPDLFSAKPVVLTGRYTAPARGKIRLLGKMSGQEFERVVPVDFSRDAKEHDVLAKLWARTRIDDLMARDYGGIQQGAAKPEIREAITQLGLDYHLMTQFTSFVAVEDRIITEGGEPKTVAVPVEMPEGVSYEGVFGGTGSRREIAQAAPSTGLAAPQAQTLYRSAKVFDSVGEVRKKSGPREHLDRSDAGPVVRNEPFPGREGDRAGGPDQEAAGDERKDRDRLRNLEKLDPRLRSIYERVQQGGGLMLTAEEAKFSKRGHVHVQIWLSDVSEDVAKRLRALGFQDSGKSKVAKVLIGWIGIEKLPEAAALTEVRSIVPFTE